jgi:hypothetical protein
VGVGELEQRGADRCGTGARQMLGTQTEHRSKGKDVWLHAPKGRSPTRYGTPSLPDHMAQRCAVATLESRGLSPMEWRTLRTFWWNGTEFDHQAWEFGNCFKVWKDAAQAREAVKELLLRFQREEG